MENAKHQAYQNFTYINCQVGRWFSSSLWLVYRGRHASL